MLRTKFNPFPELRTERLLLRKLNLSDTPELFFLRSDDRVMEFLARPKAESEEEVKDFIKMINKNADEGISILWGISLLEDVDKLVGTICFWNISEENYRAETGYVLHPAHWRKGIMKEALLKTLDFGFNEMKLHRVEARLDPYNTASISLLESAGFVREGHLREDYFYDGKFLDTVIYSKLQS